mmetsp:Transcript_29274/g.44102  ORF Transcript_29274/g.44102 Transcript_29274/m.44102 type:complete len:151 (-) Transcript_29274:9-461(-)
MKTIRSVRTPDVVGSLIRNSGKLQNLLTKLHTFTNNSNFLQSDAFTAEGAKASGIFNNSRLMDIDKCLTKLHDKNAGRGSRTDRFKSGKPWGVSSLFKRKGECKAELVELKEENIRRSNPVLSVSKSVGQLSKLISIEREQRNKEESRVL